MDGHVWRIPTLFGVMAGSALLLFAAGVAGSVVTRRRHSATHKLATGAVLGLLAVLGGIAVRATAAMIARSLEIHVMYVDPGPLGYLAPIAFAAFAFAVAHRLFGEAWTGWRAVLFYGWLVGFTAANVLNRCSPGWCATVGFPFTWYASSDAILTLGDAGLGYLIDRVEMIGRSIGAVLNLFVFVAVTVVVARVGSRPNRPLQPTSGADEPAVAKDSERRSRLSGRTLAGSRNQERMADISYRDGFEAEQFLHLVQRVWPREYSPQEVAAALKRTINIGAWEDGRLIGSVRILTDGYLFATIPEILVDPAYQRRGIGRRLMELAVERAPRGKVAFGAQPQSVAFFERIGCERRLTGFVAARPLRGTTSQET
jgi:ribosomal protein S18 acetylase RimI-like enzyme